MAKKENKGLKMLERLEVAAGAYCGEFAVTVEDLERGLFKEDEEAIDFIREELKEKEKQTEILRIIKNRFNIQFSKSDLPNYYGIMQIGINPVYIKTQSEYNLLKEVLL